MYRLQPAAEWMAAKVYQRRSAGMDALDGRREFDDRPACDLPGSCRVPITDGDLQSAMTPEVCQGTAIGYRTVGGNDAPDNHVTAANLDLLGRCGEIAWLNQRAAV